MKVVIPKQLLVSDNERIGGSVNGKLILSKKYRQRKGELAKFLALSLARETPIAGPVEIEGTVHWPDNHRRDLSLFIKVLHDALEGVAYANDSQIWRMAYTRGENDAVNPRLVIAIRPY